MNNDQLIQLLQDKTPEELSLEEIRLLRRRLSESDELRRALLEQLEMEQYLAEALGRIEVPVDSIVARAGRTDDSGPHPVLLAVGLIVCLGVIGFIATVMVVAITRPDQPSVAVADTDGADQDPQETPDVPAAESNPATDEASDAASPETPVEDGNEDADKTADSPDDAPPENPSGGEATDDKPATDDGAGEAPPQGDGPKPDEPEPQPPKPQGPWVAGLEAPPRPFGQTWFEDFDTSKRVPSQEDIEAWLEQAPGERLRIYEEKIQNVQYGAIQGFAKLKAPWPEDALLRFSPEKAEQLRIHCYRGERGVSLYWNSKHGGADRWAAYHVTREGKTPAPKNLRLASTDEGRDEYCEARYGPTLLLRWEAGDMVLTRGDIEMARAALPGGPPEEVYFQGETALRGIEMLRTADTPPPDTWPEPYRVIDKPAELEWAGDVPEQAKFEKRDDGSVQLAIAQAEEAGWMAAPLPCDRVRFLEIELDDIEPGASVYLGGPAQISESGEVTRPAGQPDGPGLTFATNNRDKQLVASWRQWDEALKAVDHSPAEEHSVPYVGPRCWVRFLVGASWIRCWISPDGEHWALLNWGEPFYSGQATHLGIVCARGAPQAKLTVRRIRLRELPAINHLVAADVLARAKSFAAAGDLSRWLVEVSRAQPADIETRPWRLACAHRTLATGCAAPLGQALLDLVLRSQSPSPDSAEQQLQLHDEVALLVGKWEKLPGDRTFNMFTHYFELARDLAKLGEPRPFSLVRRPMMSSLGQGRQFFKVYDADLIRHELVELVYAGNWAELARFVDMLKFYGGGKLPQVAPLAPWAEAIAARHLPGETGEGIVRLESDWQHPLVEEYSKEAYNVMAEFNAAVESESYEDAARLIAGLDPYGLSGLLPSGRDGDLLVSVQTAVAAAMRQSEQLAEVMNEQFAPLGRLRVKQAVAAGDEAAVQLATIQFHGTKAAGDAHRWLADRSLSGGEFIQAIAHYRRALVHAGVLEKPQILARMRLAGAMTGLDLGEPPQTPIRLGEMEIPADEFEALVQEMRTTHAGRATAVTAQGEAVVKHLQTPPPSGFRVERHSRLDGDMGENPYSVPGDIRQYDVPWVARQLGIAVHENIAYVNNRFHVAAYDLNNGNRLWQSPRPPGNHGRAHEWRLTAMRPVVVGDRIYVRQLIREGPVLLCLNCSDGKHVWVHQPPRDEDIVSDPHIAQGKLFALTLLDSRRGEDRLRLTSYALDTGETLGARDLVGIRQSWRQRRFCRTTQLEDSLIASLGGLVMRIDLTGSVRWARRQVLLPPGEERTWVAQRFDRPLVAQNQVVIASPGVRTVDCLDAESGRLQWRRVLPHIDRLVGVAAERVIVHAGDEFLALRLETGDADWRRQLLSPFDAELHGGPNGLLLAHKVESPDANNQFRPELVWLDPQTGEMRGRAVLSDLNHTDPRFGPLIAHQDKLWAFYGEGIQQPHRDVVQLTADGEAAPPDAAASDPDIWTEHVNDELRAAAEKVVPQWELLATAHYGGFGFVPQVHGEKQLVALPANNVSPVVFARRIRVPQSGKPKLKMRLGSEPHNNWQLVVRFGEKVLLEKDMEWSKNPNVWKDVAVDLAGVRGQQAWLTVEARFVSHGDHTRTYWKRLELAF